MFAKYAMLNNSNKLERDFYIAKEQGRYLSDDEQFVLDNRNQIRSRLITLTGVFVLLPPLWPFDFWFNHLPDFSKNNFPHWNYCNRLLPSEFFGCNRYPIFSLIRLV